VISEEKRRKVWMKLSPGERRGVLCGVIDSLINVEGISLEQSIQRCIDTFVCEHQEVIEALKELGERQEVAV